MGAQAQGGEVYRAGRPALGARLLAAAQLVQPGRVVADIGCDHGKLAVWLAKSGNAPKVIAIDNMPMPLARCRALVQQAGCENLVDCRLGSGLAPLLVGEAQEIIIAGLSGQTMEQIIQADLDRLLLGAGLVLVPTTRHAQLRRWLCEAGFTIEQEQAVTENSRSYVVMRACYTGRKTEPSELFCQLGLLAGGGNDAEKAYIATRLEYLQKQGKAPMNEAESAQHMQLIEEVKQCLQ